MFIKLLIISVLLLAVSGIFLGIRILIKKNGGFPETHISRNEEMRKRGISCAQDTNIGSTPYDFNNCSTCGKNIFNHDVSQSYTACPDPSGESHGVSAE